MLNEVEIRILNKSRSPHFEILFYTCLSRYMYIIVDSETSQMIRKRMAQEWDSGQYAPVIACDCLDNSAADLAKQERLVIGQPLKG